MVPVGQAQLTSPPSQQSSPGLVVWLYGLSGSGKTTLSRALALMLERQRHKLVSLDGDVLRSGLCSDLGFSDEDRFENIRRAAHVASLFSQAGLIVLASFITPQEKLRCLAREIIGKENFLGVYLNCGFAVCARRDVKGLYALAAARMLENFSGKDSVFEVPESADLVLNTGAESPEACAEKLFAHVLSRLTLA